MSQLPIKLAPDPSLPLPTQPYTGSGGGGGGAIINPTEIIVGVSVSPPDIVAPTANRLEITNTDTVVIGMHVAGDVNNVGLHATPTGDLVVVKPNDASVRRDVFVNNIIAENNFQGNAVTVASTRGTFSGQFGYTFSVTPISAVAMQARCAYLVLVDAANGGGDKSFSDLVLCNPTAAFPIKTLDNGAGVPARTYSVAGGLLLVTLAAGESYFGGVMVIANVSAS